MKGKNLYILIAVVVALVLWYMMRGSAQTTPAPVVTEEETVTEDEVTTEEDGAMMEEDGDALMEEKEY